MHFNRKRIAAVAAVSAISVLAPAASAGAATLPTGFPSLAGFSLPAYNLPTFAFPAGGLPAFTPGAGSFVGPSVGGISSVIGPTVITVGAGNIFTGTTITTSGGGAVVGAGTGAP
jgi:hypothetical protein